MKTLVPSTSRTTKQILKRLYNHFNGLPIQPGNFLAGIAKMMPLVDRESEIIFLTKKHSVWVVHCILVFDGKVLIDHNTFLNSTFDHDTGEYRALELNGTPFVLETRKRMSIEEFITKSQLFDRFRVSQKSPLREEDQ